MKGIKQVNSLKDSPKKGWSVRSEMGGQLVVKYTHFWAFRRNLIALLAGDDASDPAAGLLHIALVAGDEVDMGMGHGLAGGGMDIDPHIEPVGVELPLEDGFDLIQEDKAVRLLLKGQVKVIGAMPGGDHQSMPLAHRELIKNGISHRGFRDHRPIRWEGTKGTGGRLVHAGGLNGWMVLWARFRFSTPQTPGSRSGNRSCFGVVGCR